MAGIVPDEFLDISPVGLGVRSDEPATFRSRTIPKQRPNTLTEILTLSAPLTVASAIDTIGRSVGLLEDESVLNFLGNINSTVGDFYARNKSALGLAGDMTGMFIPGLIGVKALRGATFLSRSLGLENSLLSRSLFLSGSRADAAMRAVQYRDAFLASQAGHFAGKNFAADQARKVLARQALSLRVADNIKWGVAFELGVAGGMHESENLYPSEFTLTEHIAVAGLLGVVIPGGASYFITNRALRRSIQSALRNKSADPAIGQRVTFDDVIKEGAFRGPNPNSLAGANRGELLAVWALSRETGSVAQAGDISIELRNALSADALEIDKIFSKQIDEAFNDSITGVSGTATPNSAEKLNVANALREDPMTLVGLYKLAKLGDSQKLIDNLEVRRKEVEETIQQAISAFMKEADVAEVSIRETRQLFPELYDIAGRLARLQFHVLEPTGDITNLLSRKPRWLDSHVLNDFELKPAQGNQARIYSTKDDELIIGWGNDGYAIISGKKGVETDLPPGFTIIKNAMGAVDELPEFQLKLLNRIVKDYHFEEPLGSQLLRDMPDLHRRAVENAMKQWAGSSRESLIRKWAEKNAEEFEALYNAYAPLRADLHDLAREGDGTLWLFRGERASETRKPKHDVVSYSADYKVARGFAGPGGHVIARRVPIDDIVAIGAGFKGENEIIVRGNLNRIFTASGTKPSAGLASAEALAELGFKPRTVLFAGIQRAVRDFLGTKQRLVLHEGDHWTRHEYALALRDFYGDKALGNRVLLPKSYEGNWQQLEYAVARAKYREFVKLRKDLEFMQNESTIKAPASQRLTDDDIFYMLNMPRDVEKGSAIGELFRNMYVRGVGHLEDEIANIDQLKRILQEEMAGSNITSFKDKLPPIRGKQMTPLAFDSQPVVMLKSPVDPKVGFHRDAIEQVTVQRRQELLTEITQAASRGAIIVDATAKEIMNNSDFALARQVDLVAEGAQAGKQVFGQQYWSVGESPTMQALRRLIALSDRSAEKMVGDIFKPHSLAWNRLRSPAHSGDLLATNLWFQSNRYGWYLAEELVEAPGGRWMFALNMEGRNGTFNRRKWKELFGEELPEDLGGETIFMPQIKRGAPPSPLILSDASVEAIAGLVAVGEQVLQEKNFLRSMYNLSPINKKAWHIPPPRLGGRHVRYIMRPDGQAKTVVVGRTNQEVTSKANQLLEKGEYLLDQEQMSDFFQFVDDEAFMGLIDYSDPQLQTGVAAKGSFGSPITEIGDAPIRDVIQTLENQLQSVIRRSRALIFEPQINYARSAHNASGRHVDEGSIWQTYTSMIFGNQALTPKTMVGGFYYTIEHTMDKVLNILHDRMVIRFARGASGTGGAKTLEERVRGQDKVYQALEKQMGDFKPFKDTQDYIENTFRVSAPANLRGGFGVLNEITSALVLRVLEVGHAVLNTASLAATTPAVLRALAKIPNETQLEWKSRIGSIGSTIENTPVLHPGRLMVSATHRMFTEEGRQVMKEAAEKGWLDQYVAEITRTLTSPQQGYAARMIRRSTETLSFLSDKSERFSRAFSFMTGYEVGRVMKFTNKNDHMAFAFDFANKNIGDYRATNRPQIFQGAVGMPLGLFQTFMWNYMTRQLSYVENKQWRALATQYFMQASVFGMISVPGWEPFVDYFATSQDGITNPVDAIQNRFGPEAADLILYGSISNIPKFFSDDGIAIYTRGSIDPRVQNLFSPTATPIGNLASSTYQILAGVLDQFRTGGQPSQQRMMELLGTYSISRPLKGLFEIAAGVSVDRRGQLVEENTRTPMSVAARLIGSKPLSEAQMNEAYSRVRAAEYSQFYIRDRMNDSFRAMLRSGKITGDSMETLVHDYMRSGGRPENFMSWLRDAMVIASVTRQSRKLKEVVNSRRFYDLMRLVNAGILPESDPVIAAGD